MYEADILLYNVLLA